MRKLLLPALFVLSAGAASAVERQASIEVSELSCPSCPYIAAQAIEGIDSVEILEGDYDAAAQMMVVVVSYDDAVTTPEAIAEATMQYGYPGRVVDPASGS